MPDFASQLQKKLAEVGFLVRNGDRGDAQNIIEHHRLGKLPSKLACRHYLVLYREHLAYLLGEVVACAVLGGHDAKNGPRSVIELDRIVFKPVVGAVAKSLFLQWVAAFIKERGEYRTILCRLIDGDPSARLLRTMGFFLWQTTKSHTSWKIDGTDVYRRRFTKEVLLGTIDPVTKRASSGRAAVLKRYPGAQPVYTVTDQWVFHFDGKDKFLRDVANQVDGHVRRRGSAGWRGRKNHGDRRRSTYVSFETGKPVDY